MFAVNGGRVDDRISIRRDCQLVVEIPYWHEGRRPLDRIIRGLYADSYERFTLDPETKPLFLRFRLPAGQSGELMRLLAKEGITAASLYPGFGGAAESVKEAQLWPDTVSRVATPTKRRKPTRKKAKRAP